MAIITLTISLITTCPLSFTSKDVQPNHNTWHNPNTQLNQWDIVTCPSSSSPPQNHRITTLLYWTMANFANSLP